MAHETPPGEAAPAHLAPRPERTAAGIEAILRAAVPDASNHRYTIEAITARGARVRWAYGPDGLRPGGTVSGPVMMTLADTAMYAALLARLDDGRMAVTSQMNMHFLRRPPPTDLVGWADIMRLGRRQAVIEVRIFAGEGEPVALCTGIYALPG